MADHSFYSDRVNGPRAATHDALPAATSRGLLGLVDAKVTANWLARAFPESCPDGKGICDTDLGTLTASMQALVPGAPWPLLRHEAVVADETVFDLIEYAAARVAEPIEGQYHGFFGHHELDFNPKKGRKAFRAEVNAILQRGQTMYELRDNGEIHRRGTPEVQAVIAGLNPASGDDVLDRLIVEARSRYTSHRPSERRVALERLWDAFERLKTIDLPGGDKRKSVQVLLSNLDEEGWRATIAAEMRALTDIGNQYSIRHHETRTDPVPEDGGADYLFARMGALITLLLKASRRVRLTEPTFSWEQ